MHLTVGHPEIKHFGNPKNENLLWSMKGGLLAKSKKLFFQGRAFLEGKIQKMQKKKFQKILLSQIVC